MANITIKDVARKAGVGIGTVSRVLNNSSLVKDSTRQQVLSAIDALDYQPSQIARRLSLGKTNTVAVIAPFFTEPAFVERLRGIVSVIGESEYDFVLYNVDSEGSRNKYFSELSRPERADGVLIMALMPNQEQAERFAQSNIPTVLVDADHDDFDRVVIDDFTGGYKATKHLLTLGHRRIGTVIDHLASIPFNNNVAALRHAGYCKALADADLPICPDYVVECDLDRQAAKEAGLKMLSMPERPTAIFAYSDTQAFGVMQAAKELNINIPAELSLIGYDDIELAEYLDLTTMRQNLFDVGVSGAQLLLDKLSAADSAKIHEASPSKKICKRIVSPKLVVRKTTARI